MNHFLILRDKVKLYFNIVDNNARSWIILSHGLCEHSGRHAYLKEHFSDFNIVFYDLRGHGKSGGMRTHIEDFDDFSMDLEELLSYLSTEKRMQDYILMGFSLGTIVVCDFLQKRSKKVFAPSKVFLSSPPVTSFGLNFKAFLPFLKLIPMNIRLSRPFGEFMLSHDRRILYEYQKDPLSSQRFSLELFMHISDATERIYSQELNPPCPVYVACGSEDKFLSVNSVKKYFSIMGPAKTEVIEGAYHELHHETHNYSVSYFKFLKRSLSGG